MKRTALALLLACVIVLASTGVAFANYGPHGAYVQDTDACAACHRAHTSFSNLTWTDQTGYGQRSALLVSQGSNMTQFCYACHGNDAPGASTNVQNGVFDAGPTGANGAAITGSVHFASASSLDATLNGGGFKFVGKSSPTSGQAVNSAHNVDALANFNPDLILWGNVDLSGNAALNTMGQFTCIDCHDPHGSSNYRLLKDTVNGKAVGGYNTAGKPAAYVSSNELNFPENGFSKGATGVAEVAAYVPNYTAAEYVATAGKGMDAWCGACHGAYLNQTSTYDYGSKLDIGTSTDPAYNSSSTLDTLQTSVTYHRHPVGVTLATNGPDGTNHSLVTTLQLDPGLPLAMTFGKGVAKDSAGRTWDYDGAIGCLTCHRAHGTEATMSGWAVATLVGGKVSLLTTVGASPSNPASSTNANGVAPNYDASLLRYNNRGVCERCHNK